nr:acyl-CoA dehydrogenase family protein [Rhodococcus oxybenzonivorans]
MLRGRKRWITNSVVAGVVVVLARTGLGLTTFIVPPMHRVSRSDPRPQAGESWADHRRCSSRRRPPRPDSVLGRVGVDSESRCRS